MPQNTPIHKFYAVTLSRSLYLVSDEKDSHKTPIVEKIALLGESRVLPGECLHNGELVGITRRGIFLYFKFYGQESTRSDKIQRLEDVNTYYWGGHSTYIVGLFLKESSARRCLNSKNLKICDSRWKNKTTEVLKLIGDDHPVFILPQDKDLEITY